jgi:hypothetical protein
MPLGVLSRFWMQPDVLTAVILGRGLVLVFNAALGLLAGVKATCLCCGTEAQFFHQFVS